MANFEVFINGTYVTMYNRTADNVGFNWASGVAGLSSVAATRTTAVSTLEAQSLAATFRGTQADYFNSQYGNLAPRDAILKLYQNLGGNTDGVDEAAINYWTNELSKVGGDLSKLAGQFTLEFLNYNGTDAAGLVRQQSLNNRVAVSQSWVNESAKPINEFMNAKTVNDAAFQAQTQIIAGVGASTTALSQAFSQINQVINSRSLTPVINIPRFLTVQQVVAGEDQGKPYILNDLLKNIAANDTVRTGALSFQITNWPGTVGAATVKEATVLQSALNAKEYSYSLTDSIGNIWPTTEVPPGLSSLIIKADTVSIVGTDASETLLLSFFPRNVIINGHGGDDRMIGGGFNDVFYGGSGTNQYFGNGGNDTYNLETGATDLVNLSKSSNKSFDGIQFIKNFGPNDKIVLRQDDVTANLEGSWTQDDFGQKFFSGVAPNENYSLSAFHGAAVVSLMEAVDKNFDLDAAVDGRNLLPGRELASGRPALNGNQLFVQQNWAGFLVGYEPAVAGVAGKAFIYFANDANQDSRLSASEIKLVATVARDASWGPGEDGWLQWTNFAL
ncbi:RTX calcium-binding nonapeptide repeat [Rhabdaerophilaceae bacterium]